MKMEKVVSGAYEFPLVIHHWQPSVLGLKEQPVGEWGEFGDKSRCASCVDYRVFFFEGFVAVRCRFDVRGFLYNGWNSPQVEFD